MFLTILLLFFIGTIGCRVSGKDTEICKSEKNMTLMCNFIPKTIPEGISSVKVNLGLNSESLYILTKTTFASENWAQVKQIEISETSNSRIKLRDRCFEGLVNLEELRIHAVGPLEIASDAFAGIDLVKTLDLTSSIRVEMKFFMSALNGSTKLPELRNLILSNFSVMLDSIDLDDEFLEVLQFRKISYLDLSSVQFRMFNFTALIKKLNFLEKLNVSYTNIADIWMLKLAQNDLRRLKIFDFSYSALPKSEIPFLPGQYDVPCNTFQYSKIPHLKKIITLLTPENVNLSGLIPSKISLTLNKCSVVLDENPNILTKSVIIRDNNFKKLDVRITCSNFHIVSVQNVDISNNGLEFLHPESLSCTTNLKKINLSKNKLSYMANKDSELFEKLFSSLSVLENVDLSRNELLVLPPKMFEACRKLRVLDLSNNKLKQVHFSLKKLQNLQVLDIHGNEIHNLDSVSIKYLTDIRKGNNVAVILKMNPFSCASCTSMPSIEWLLTTNLVNMSSQKLTCLAENGKGELISKSTLDKVNQICARKTIILSSTIIGGSSIVVLLVVMLLFYRRKQMAQKHCHRIRVINLLRDGEGVYEFAAFLAFSNDDKEFVKANIFEHLTENLQSMTGIDRELICTGDQHFRPGFYVHNECFRCLDTASVMVVVVSNSFCLSEYCLNELEQAHVKRKPIVLMLIEHVDVNVMSPTLKELYRSNARIVWADENGKRVLKTTWQNICNSILDLVKLP